MKRTYHFVQPCPRCGDDATGYYVYCTESNADSIKNDCLKRGELVRVIIGMKDNSNPNCFCSACGLEWRGQIEIKKMDKDDIADEQELRNINIEKISRKQRKRERKIKKKNMRKARFARVNQYIKDMFL